MKTEAWEKFSAAENQLRSVHPPSWLLLLSCCPGGVGPVGSARTKGAETEGDTEEPPVNIHLVLAGLESVLQAGLQISGTDEGSGSGQLTWDVKRLISLNLLRVLFNPMFGRSKRENKRNETRI